MQIAIEEAKASALMGEVPVGAIAVLNGECIAKAHNLRESTQDPSAHAEMLVLRQAAQKLNSWRLIDVHVYVTLEPCPMCAGAMLNARLPHLIWGCNDPKAGAMQSLYQLGDDPRLNHRIKSQGGILKAECSALLSGFFQTIRARQQSKKNT